MNERKSNVFNKMKLFKIILKFPGITIGNLKLFLSKCLSFCTYDMIPPDSKMTPKSNIILSIKGNKEYLCIMHIIPMNAYNVWYIYIYIYMIDYYILINLIVGSIILI